MKPLKYWEDQLVQAERVLHELPLLRHTYARPFIRGHTRTKRGLLYLKWLRIQQSNARITRRRKKLLAQIAFYKVRINTISNRNPWDIIRKGGCPF